MCDWNASSGGPLRPVPRNRRESGAWHWVALDCFMFAIGPKRAHAEQSGRDPLILNPTTRKQLKEVVDIRKEIINVRFGSLADIALQLHS